MTQAVEEQRPTEANDELIRIEDIATVRMGYLEPPITRMRFNGQEALALSLANATGGNVLAYSFVKRWMSTAYISKALSFSFKWIGNIHRSCSFSGGF